MNYRALSFWHADRYSAALHDIDSIDFNFFDSKKA